MAWDDKINRMLNKLSSAGTAENKRLDALSIAERLENLQKVATGSGEDYKEGVSVSDAIEKLEEDIHAYMARNDSNPVLAASLIEKLEAIKRYPRENIANSGRGTPPEVA